jgi:hypothetical protein
MRPVNTNTASVGLKARTGRAIAVVLRGPAESPQIIKRTELALTDPRVPETSQPHHEVMDLPWNEAQVAVQPFVSAIESVAAAALAQLVQELESESLKVVGVGVVGAADRDLRKIGNPHIRAHAAEGVLFRQVLEAAAKANGLAKRSFIERGFEECAATELGYSVAKLNGYLARLGRAAGPPWRAEQRVAALAAWLMLATK